MREKIMRFMQGRYGNDRLGQAMLMAALACVVLSLFRIPFISTIGLAILVLTYYRMFSRQIAKRAAENQKYMQLEWKVRAKLQKKKQSLAQRRTHRIYKCPNCKQKIRVPRNRGRIAISCRKCGTEFIRKT
jgi:Gamma-aminobutyrate permease and related permeases